MMLLSSFYVILLIARHHITSIGLIQSVVLADSTTGYHFLRRRSISDMMVPLHFDYKIDRAKMSHQQAQDYHCVHILLVDCQVQQIAQKWLCHREIDHHCQHHHSFVTKNTLTFAKGYCATECELKCDHLYYVIKLLKNSSLIKRSMEKTTFLLSTEVTFDGI